MNAVLLALSLALLVGALCGPWALGSAAPLLMRIPRIAVTLLVGSLLLWMLTAVSLSLMSAWMISGANPLPEAFTEVCQRCLAAANPFGSITTIDTSLPPVVFLLLPALTMLAVVAFSVPKWARRHRANRLLSAKLLARGRATTVAGHEVLVIEDPRPLAFSLSRAAGGIVVSDALLTSLSRSELEAVLAHEQAHVRQRHHTVVALLCCLTWAMRWVPLARAVADAVPHYLEIAADNAARQHSGTPVLASALLKLGAPKESEVGLLAGASGASPLMHAAGPERIGHLVAPSKVRPAVLPASALIIQLVAFAVVTASIHGPYAYVFLTGC